MYTVQIMQIMQIIRADINQFQQANGRIATKRAHDGLQVSVHPGCVQGKGQSKRSRDTGTFVLARKSLLEDYWDTWNYSLFASSLQSNISGISIKFARWQHDCGRSLLSTIALFKQLFLSRPVTALGMFEVFGRTGPQTLRGDRNFGHQKFDIHCVQKKTPTHVFFYICVENVQIYTNFSGHVYEDLSILWT